MNPSFFGWQGEYRIAFEVSCLPEAELQVEAERIRCAAGPLFESIQTVGHDTVRGTSRLWALSSASNLTDLCAVVLAAAPDGHPLMVEIITRKANTSDAAEHLVLYGLVENGSLTLKALWAKVPPHDDGSLYLPAVWPDEEALIGAFEQCRAFEQLIARPEGGIVWFDFGDSSTAGKVATNLRNAQSNKVQIETDGSVLRTSATQRQLAHAAIALQLTETITATFSTVAMKQGSWIVKAGFGMNETLPAFFLRTGAFLLPAVLFFWLMRQMDGWTGRLLTLAAGIFFVVIFAATFGWKAYLIFMYRKLMRDGMRTVYSKPMEFTVLESLPEMVAQDPAVRKWTADALALGGKHVIDLDVHNTGCKSIARCFYIPAQRTFLQVMCLYELQDGLQHFPANSNFLATTYFPDGVNVVCTNARMGYRKRLDPRSVAKAIPEALTPRQLLDKHSAVLAGFTPPGAALEFDAKQFLARSASDHLSYAKRMEKYGYYRWEDAVREVFNIVRPDFKA